MLQSRGGRGRAAQGVPPVTAAGELPPNPESRPPDFAAAVTGAIAAGLNHLLRSASWARDALRPHAGKTVRLEIAPFSHALTVLDNGEVAPAASGARPSTRIQLTPGVMLRVVANDETAWQDVHLEGDTELGTVIHHLARHLRWDAEEDLSRVFGDILAHRMVRSGRELRRWSEQALENTGRSFAEYWTEEQPLIAGARDLDAFYRDVDQLRDAVDRLEKRIENLAGNGQPR